MTETPIDKKRRSRKFLVDWITDTRGYSDRHERFAIEFNVAAYYADFSFENVWARGPEIIGPDRWNSSDFQNAKPQVEELYNQHAEHLWDWGVEDARRSVLEDDTYNYDRDGVYYNVTWSFRGSGGKHLCLELFEGHDMRFSEEELGERMLRQSDLHGNGYDFVDKGTLRKGYYWYHWPYKDLLKLYRYLQWCQQWFNQKAASEEVEYQGIFCFWANIVESEIECLSGPLQLDLPINSVQGEQNASTHA